MAVPVPLAAPSLLVRGARLWGSDGPTDLLLRDGLIAAIGSGLGAVGQAELFDGRGCLVIPGLVDGHCHLDKTLWGTPWHPHRAGPTLRDRIDNERQVRTELGLSPKTQGERLLRRMLACGTTHARTHVDIDPSLGLSHFHALQQVQADHQEAIDIEIVAFPQSGVMSCPGTLDLLEQAVREGAQAVGGLDPMGVDGDAKGQLDGLFAIADRHGCDIDIHLHDRGELGALTIEMIAERSRSLCLAGKVAISHAFCLGSVDDTRLEGLIALLVEQDIAVMTHAASGATPLPPVRLLSERGARLFSGSDGVRDSWGPLNNGDMLERAYLVAYRNGFRDDAGIETALRMVTLGGAQVMGASGHGLAVGSAADLVLVEAETAAEAVVMHPPRRAVFKRGRQVAGPSRA
jgi:cytosine deaminase